MFIKAVVFQRDCCAGEPCPHFFERDRKLSPRLRRRELPNFSTATVEQRQSSGGRLLQFVWDWNPPDDRHRRREDDSRTNDQRARNSGERTRPRVLAMAASPSRTFRYARTCCAGYAQSVSARAPKRARGGTCAPQTDSAEIDYSEE